MGPILGFGTLPNRLRMTENLCNHCLIQRRVYIKPWPKSQIEQRVSTAQNFQLQFAAKILTFGKKTQEYFFVDLFERDKF